MQNNGICPSPFFGQTQNTSVVREWYLWVSSTSWFVWYFPFVSQKKKTISSPKDQSRPTQAFCFQTKVQWKYQGGMIYLYTIQMFFLIFFQSKITKTMSFLSWPLTPPPTSALCPCSTTRSYSQLFTSKLSWNLPSIRCKLYPGSPRPNKEWSLGWSMRRIPYYQWAKFGLWTSWVYKQL